MSNLLTGQIGNKLYFIRRYIEEMVLAQTAADAEERLVHLRACDLYSGILGMGDLAGAADAPEQQRRRQA